MDNIKLEHANRLKHDINKYSKEIDKIDAILESSDNNNLIKLYIEGRIFNIPLNKEVSIEITKNYIKFTNDYLIKCKKYCMNEIVKLEKEFKSL